MPFCVEGVGLKGMFCKVLLPLLTKQANQMHLLNKHHAPLFGNHTPPFRSIICLF